MQRVGQRQAKGLGSEHELTWEIRAGDHCLSERVPRHLAVLLEVCDLQSGGTQGNEDLSEPMVECDAGWTGKDTLSRISRLVFEQGTALLEIGVFDDEQPIRPWVA